MKTADELVAMALPSVLEGLKAEIRQTIDWQVKEQAGKLVASHVTEWMKENILPELTKQLVESKDGLMALSAELAPKMVEMLAESLLSELKEKLEKSWERNKIFESMFK